MALAASSLYAHFSLFFLTHANGILSVGRYLHSRFTGLRERKRGKNVVETYALGEGRQGRTHYSKAHSPHPTDRPP